MPYKAEERDGKWVIINTDTDEVRAERDNEEDAKRFVKLLTAIENDPSWVDNEGDK